LDRLARLTGKKTPLLRGDFCTTAIGMVRGGKLVPARRSRRTVKISPLRALAEVRKPVPAPTRIEDGARIYRRGRDRRATREIIADETGGC
jgi:hypothetical protein